MYTINIHFIFAMLKRCLSQNNIFSINACNIPARYLKDTMIMEALGAGYILINLRLAGQNIHFLKGAVAHWL